MDLHKFAVSDQHEGSLGATEKSHSFIVDIENMSSPSIKETSANSRISVKLQGNLSRKGSRREDKNKSILSASSGVTDRSYSRGITVRVDDCNPSKSPLVPVESLTMKDLFDKQPQTITTMAENRCQSKIYTKQRSFGIGPKQVLLFFATLSSMGTLILIYFTLSINKFNGDSNTQAPQ